MKITPKKVVFVGWQIVGDFTKKVNNAWEKTLDKIPDKYKTIVVNGTEALTLGTYGSIAAINSIKNGSVLDWGDVLTGASALAIVGLDIAYGSRRKLEGNPLTKTLLEDEKDITPETLARASFKIISDPKALEEATIKLFEKRFKNNLKSRLEEYLMQNSEIPLYFFSGKNNSSNPTLSDGQPSAFYQENAIFLSESYYKQYGRHNYSEDTEGRKRAIEEAILEINLRDFITHNSNFKDSNSKFHNEEEFSAMMLWSISNKKTDNKLKNHPFSAERNYCSIIAQNFPKEKPFEILFNSDSKEYDEVAIDYFKYKMSSFYSNAIYFKDFNDGYAGEKMPKYFFAMIDNNGNSLDIVLDACLKILDDPLSEHKENALKTAKVISLYKKISEKEINSEEYENLFNEFKSCLNSHKDFREFVNFSDFLYNNEKSNYIEKNLRDSDSELGKFVNFVTPSFKEAMEQTSKDVQNLKKEISKLSEKDLAVYKKASELKGDRLLIYQTLHPRQFPDHIKAVFYLGMAGGLVSSGLQAIEPFKVLRGAMLGYAGAIWKFFTPVRDPDKFIDKSDYIIRENISDGVTWVKSIVGATENRKNSAKESRHNLRKRMVSSGGDAFSTANESTNFSAMQAIWEIANGDIVGGITRLVGSISGFMNNTLMKLASSKNTEDFYGKIKEAYLKKLETGLSDGRYR